MNYPTPAIVTQREVKRLPRIVLLLICVTYILPGLIGRDPWRNDDLIAFGYMNAIAQGSTSWLNPELLGHEPSGGLIPYWIGALFIKVLPFLDAPVAARIPFVLLLMAIFAFTWHACYYLARTEPAQPISFAFGGEARPNDYARAIADGALLALIASLGLLLPAHETTPELMQMGGIAFFLFCLAAAPFKGWWIRLCTLLSLPVLALSGLPVIAVVLGIVGAVMCFNSEYEKARKVSPYFVLGFVISIGLSSLLLTSISHHTSTIAITIHNPVQLLLDFLKNMIWYSWPTWPLMLWSLWSWRYLWRRRHISAPLVIIIISAIGYFLTDGNKDYLLYLLPAMAVLAAFAMPTFKRGISALMDWFALMLYTALMIAGWFYWYAMMTGTPTTPAQKLLRLLPGFEPSFSLLLFMVALAATIAWLAMVRWRTGRHQPAIWKGMVLSAGGVTMCWVMLMTLGLDALDYVRSLKPWTQKIEHIVIADKKSPSCIATKGLTEVQIASWSWKPGIPLKTEDGDCPYLIVNAPSNKFIPLVDNQRWVLHNEGLVFRPSDRTLQDRILIYQRLEND
ncbi:MAG: ArnT family glycosyltransferase [Saezia sp.]